MERYEDNNTSHGLVGKREAHYEPGGIIGWRDVSYVLEH